MTDQPKGSVGWTMSREEDLKKLSHRALVALAARCAMRVRPLFQVPNDRHQQALDTAIRIACEYASRSKTFVNASVDEAVSNAYTAARAAEATSGPAFLLTVADALDYIVASRAAASAETAAHALEATTRGEDSLLSNYYTEYGGSRAIADTHASAEAAEAYNRDLDTLLALNPKQIDPSESGPLSALWPNGEPRWKWDLGRPTIVDRLKVFEAASPIQVYFDVAEFSAEEIATILGGFSELYHAISGDLLVIKKTETLDFSCLLIPEGV